MSAAERRIELLEARTDPGLAKRSDSVQWEYSYDVRGRTSEFLRDRV